MLDTAIFSRIRTAAGRFTDANQGNIAVLFAIAAVPVLTFVGAAIDYTRANSARTAMQGALDSTALMLAKDLSDNNITTSQITQKAQDYFLALYTNTDAKQVGVTASYTQNTGAGSNIVLSGSGTVDTDFLRIAGFPSINFNTSSTSTWGNTRMRVAMVLDNTGSMASNGKMAGSAKSRERHDRHAVRASTRRTATSTFQSFHSQKTSTSAPRTSARPGSIGRIGKLSLPFS